MAPLGGFAVVDGQAESITNAVSQTFSYTNPGFYLEPFSDSLPASFTTCTLPTAQQWWGVCYGNGKFVAVPFTSGTGGAYFAMTLQKPSSFSIIPETVSTTY